MSSRFGCWKSGHLVVPGSINAYNTQFPRQKYKKKKIFQHQKSTFVLASTFDVTPIRSSNLKIRGVHISYIILQRFEGVYLRPGDRYHSNESLQALSMMY